jgi:hypothetical protein
MMGKTDCPHLPGSLTHLGTDRPLRDVMRTLYEAALAVHFDGRWFEAYVNAPAAAADRVLLRYNNEHDPRAGWERTQMHPAALTRALRQRDWQLVAATHVPTVEASHAE